MKMNVAQKTKMKMWGVLTTPNVVIISFCVLFLLSFVDTSLQHDLRSSSLSSLSSQGNLQEVLKTLNATSFLELVNEAGLEDLLTMNTSQHTLFAPTNAAIAALHVNFTHQQLVATVQYHFMNGAHLVSSFSDGQLLPSLLVLTTLKGGPQPLEVTVVATTPKKETFIINKDAQVVDADVMATNGIVHVVDHVLLPPPDLPTEANITANLSTFSSIIRKAAGLVNILAQGNVTVFAPTDAAFAAVPALVGYLLLPNSSSSLENILLYHVINDAVMYSVDIPLNRSTLKTAEGEDVNLYNNGHGLIQVNNFSVTVPNVLTSTGVIHELSGVLTPPTFNFTLQMALAGLNETILLTLINQTGLNGIINGSNAYTIFSPTNSAFVKDKPNLDKRSTQQVTDIIKTHVVEGRNDILKAGQELKTLNGKTLVVSSDGKSIHIKDSEQSSVFVGNVTKCNNGDVYVIDSVLVMQESDDGASDLVVIVVLVTCVPFLLFLLALVVLYDLRAWWKKRKALGYSAINAD